MKCNLLLRNLFYAASVFFTGELVLWLKTVLCESELILHKSSAVSNATVTLRKPLGDGRFYLADYVEGFDAGMQRDVESKYEFQCVFNLIKATIDEMYKRENVKYAYCSFHPATLHGAINFTVLFNNSNLAQLTKFYDELSHNLQAVNASGLQINERHQDFNLLDRDTSYGVDVHSGGSWSPKNCFSHSKVAIIIPYRDRFVHLAVLLRSLHMLLQRQLIDYRIFVTEINVNKSIPFNKGRIMNAAYLEALKLEPTFDCFVFHDVDLISENDFNMYTCHQHVKHMSVAIDKFYYQMLYDELIGGVLSVPTRTFAASLNGYSNSYWGWGGEDDDMFERLKMNNLTLIRPSMEIGRYKMVKHSQQKLNAKRHEILEKVKVNYKFNGVNQVNYTLVSVKFYKGFTHFLFDVGFPDLKAT